LRPTEAAGGGWVLGLVAQTDEHSSRCAFATVNWGVGQRTRLSFADLESALGHGSADRAESGCYGGVTLLIYGR
jgi:hypothetical protein